MQTFVEFGFDVRSIVHKNESLLILLQSTIIATRIIFPSSTCFYHKLRDVFPPTQRNKQLCRLIKRLPDNVFGIRVHIKYFYLYKPYNFIWCSVTKYLLSNYFFFFFINNLNFSTSFNEISSKLTVSVCKTSLKSSLVKISLLKKTQKILSWENFARNVHSVESKNKQIQRKFFMRSSSINDLLGWRPTPPG